MQIKGVDGIFHEIAMDEAKRFVMEMEKHLSGAHAVETNINYKLRALGNIRRDAEKFGMKNIMDSEKDMKEILSEIFEINPDKADLFGEIIEWFIADHSMKTGK